MIDELTTQTDRMRYTKNTASSRMALLAIVFDVLFFVSIYKSDVGTYYYTILIGASIIYNLVFMLAAFLCSEGVKNYKKGYSWVLILLAVLQIARIFILPVKMHTAVNGAPIETSIQILSMHFNVTMDNLVMGDWQFIRVCFYLIASAFCLFRAAMINIRKSNALAAHLENLGLMQA